MVKLIFLTLGIKNYSDTDAFGAIFALLILCAVVGTIADILLRGYGFGIFGNTGLLFILTCVFLYLYSAYVQPITMGSPVLTMSICITCTLVTLIILASIKNHIVRT